MVLEGYLIINIRNIPEGGTATCCEGIETQHPIHV